MTTEVRIEKGIITLNEDIFVKNEDNGHIANISCFNSFNEDEEMCEYEVIGFNIGYDFGLSTTKEAWVSFELTIKNAEFLAKSILAMIEAKRNNK